MSTIARPPAAVMPRWLLYTTALFAVAVALFSYRYLAPGMQAPPMIQANAYRAPWLFIHAAGAASALLIGAFQFSTRLRARRLAAHRWLGRAYVAGCMVGGVAGLVLAIGASTGSVSTAGFGLLALAWIGTTGLAWRRVLQGRLAEHRAWMVRSFALTLSAVTLRLYLPLAFVLPFPFAASYGAIAFLCWVPNLVLAEAWLRRS
ncbi:DUF2306 domain-containing protein [uncultured Massilia sp.]|uniref:DUF2306 domain-containing protein n=1 Tax=uncultured Massilia sp. TaxID=169973 RepID=UPI00258DEBDC|nr:DUF2306 domain-containing protein [uncultured Massilia sp.]